MKKSKIAIELLAVCTLLGASGLANAGLLSIIGGATPAEVLGDAGGTHVPGGPGAGPGLPTVNGGWADTASFGNDSSFNNARGITGFHSGRLFLNADANVTFQFMGGGNSTQQNEVFVIGGVPSPLFTDSTTPCTAPGSGSVSCTPGVNQFTFHFAAGYVPFQFLTGNGITLDNMVAGSNSDPHTSNRPGYFLGMDSYLTSTSFDTTGAVAYAGLTDLPAPGDHDFQDMGVRISAVPEPTSLALLGIGAAGFSLGKRRKTAAQMV